MNKSIEELVISNFILRRRRDRARFELLNEKKRNHFLWHMQDNGTFDPVCMERIEEPVSSSQIIYDILKQYGAPDFCYVMRQNSSYDGEIVPLEQGLEDLVFNGPGLISCLHGRLAYMEKEVPGSPGPPSRFLLVKK